MIEDARGLNGTCSRHGSIMITEDDVPICLMCRKEDALKTATPSGLEIAEDPGPIAIKAAVEGITPAPIAAKPALPPLVAGLSFHDHIEQAVAFLRKAPMPESATQFKAVNNAIKGLLKSISPKEEN